MSAIIGTSVIELRISTPFLISLGLSYIHVSIQIIQLLSLCVIVHEVQTSPRRVNSEQSMHRLLDLDIELLLALREEGKRVRNMERDYGRFQSTSRPSSPKPSLRRSSTQDNLIFVRSRTPPVRALTEPVESRVRFPTDVDSGPIVDLTLSPPSMYRDME